MTTETDRQIQAVAEAIHNAECVVPLSKRDGHIIEHYEWLAEKAIEASDAKYLPVLVEALKYYVREYDKSPCDNLIAKEALAQLPEEITR